MDETGKRGDSSDSHGNAGSNGTAADATSDEETGGDTNRRRRTTAADIATGVAIISGYLKTLPHGAGVYRMLDDKGDALYVGKAKDLKRRVTSYTQTGKHPARLLRMIAETRAMEFVVTRSDVEALLLEANLIKRLRPRYNVLLRDDKTFPHILITGDHQYPQITKHRGAEARDGQYFGPFASAGAVNRTITVLQRAFLLRNCSDAVFSNRSRPCLQYQIKRCTAPCVGFVDEQTYARQVADAVAFLKGDSDSVIAAFQARMQEASDAMDFESAARYRDRIRALAAIQAHQDINVSGLGDADIFAAHQDGGQTCIQVYFFRGGRNYGSRAYFPSHDRSLEIDDILSAFLAQFYDSKPAPPLVLLSHEIAEPVLLGEALGVRSGEKVQVATPKRGEKKRLVDHAQDNAREAMGRRLAESATQTRLLDGLAEAFDLGQRPERVEVYDNSHISGTDAVGAMIVAGSDGFQKNAYRKFTIKSAEAAGDDFAMMREVLTRRFTRALKEDPDRLQGTWPDLVLIDGGKGQLSAVMAVLGDLGVDDLAVVAVAKGPDRNAGRERFFLPDGRELTLDVKDPVLYFLQRLRDEAHRFAIGTHRARRAGRIGASPIDEIPGIGPKRKKALLMHFGSGRAVTKAGLADLEAVDGISKTVARKIHDHFHTR